MTNYQILDLSQKNKWQKYFDLLPKDQQDIYFLPEYYELYEKNGDGKAQCFVFEKNNEIALYPFLINSVNDLGYKLKKEYYDIQGAYGYNGVVSSSYNMGFINAFYEEFCLFCKQRGIIAEFTRFHPVIDNYKFSLNHLNVFENRNTVFVDLTKTKEEIWQKSYTSKNRNMIRKSIKRGVSIKKKMSEEDYDFFYKLYSKTMVDLNAEEYLFFSENYIRNFKKLLSQNHIVLFAFLNDKIIGCLMLMFFGKYAHYHLSGRDREYVSNNLLLDFAIKYAQEKGCSILHLGGGITDDEKDSLLKFKANFSKSKIKFYIGKRIHNNDIYQQLILSYIAKNGVEEYEKVKNFLQFYR